jgi:hypothetical protein
VRRGDPRARANIFSPEDDDVAIWRTASSAKKTAASHSPDGSSTNHPERPRRSSSLGFRYDSPPLGSFVSRHRAAPGRARRRATRDVLLRPPARRALAHGLR